MNVSSYPSSLAISGFQDFCPVHRRCAYQRKLRGYLFFASQAKAPENGILYLAKGRIGVLPKVVIFFLNFRGIQVLKEGFINETVMICR